MTELVEFVGFVNAVNKGPGTNFQPGDFLVKSIATATGGKNASAVLEGVPARHLTGEVTVKYDRLNLGTEYDEYHLRVTLTRDPITAEAVCTALRARWGLEFNPADLLVSGVVENKSIVPGGSFKLKAKPTALKWVGETTIYYDLPMLVLANVVTNRDLDGFKYP